MGGVVRAVIKPVTEIVSAVSEAVGFKTDTDVLKKESEKGRAAAAQKAAQEQAQIAAAEEKERKRREAALRGTLSPSPSLFSLLGTSQKRQTLG